MNRRDFLKTSLSGGLASLVPSWLVTAKRKIDLRPFCSNSSIIGHNFKRYDARHPFVQEGAGELFRYATDGKICVRVDAEHGDQEGDKLNLPPAINLRWEGFDNDGWRPWPKKNHMEATYTDCLWCKANGTADGKDAPVCDRCNGEERLDECKECFGSGRMIVNPCLNCNGLGYGSFPGIQAVGHAYIDALYDSKISEHLGDGEYRIEQYGSGFNLIQFRFDGGHCLLASLHENIAASRLAT